MARFVCLCGHTISTSGEIPNPDQWNCVSDAEFAPLADDGRVDELYMVSTLMFRCPVSDHLWFFWDGLENEPTVYTPPSGKGFRPAATG